MGVERSLNLKPIFSFKPKNESNQTHYETDPEHCVEIVSIVYANSIHLQ